MEGTDFLSGGGWRAHELHVEIKGQFGSAEQGLPYGLWIVLGPGPLLKAGVGRHVAHLHYLHFGLRNQPPDGFLGVLHAHGSYRELEVAEQAPPEPLLALRPLLL